MTPLVGLGPPAKVTRTCARCSRPLSPMTRGGLCRACYWRAVRSAAVHPVDEARLRQVLELRQEGRLNLEIAEILGCSPNAVAQAVFKLRRQGIDVPRSAYLDARREQNARGHGPAHVLNHTNPYGGLPR